MFRTPGACGCLITSMCMAALMAAPVGAGVDLGQTDNFEDGTVLNWSGHGPSIINQPGGGPEGELDNFLQLSSSGSFGSGSKLVMFNSNNQWAGDYNDAGIDAISAAMNNLGENDLAMRIAVFGAGTWFVSTDLIDLVAESGWQDVMFDLTDAAMTSVSGGASLATVLDNVTNVRVLSAENLPTVGSGGPRGDQITATLGVDNITAIPAPGGLIVLLAAAGIARRRRRYADSSPQAEVHKG